jgi:competence protein ComEA
MKSRIWNKLYILYLLFNVLGFSHMAIAQTYDQKYADWKARQEKHDENLNKQRENYALSKPEASHSGSKINLNSASSAQLQQLSGVGAKKAEAIIEFRNKNGPFKTIEEIQKVKGIGSALFEKNKTKLAI